MKILCISDPTTHPEEDSTVELYNLFADHDDFEMFHLPASGVSDSEQIMVARLESALPYSEFLTLDAKANSKMSYEDFDLAFIRADKPYPDCFLENLSQHESALPFVNSPTGMLECDDNAFLSSIANDFLPAHCFSRDTEEVTNFLETHSYQVVAKRNSGYGGKWVYKISTQGNQYQVDSISDGTKVFSSPKAVLEYLFSLDNEPYMFQEFLNNVHLGDKRVLVVDGEIYGAYLRKASEDGWINNMTTGGNATRSEIEPFEQKVVEATWPHFQNHGIRTLGYDFLTGNNGQPILSEVNAASIGGYGRLEKLSGTTVYRKLLSQLLNERTCTSS